ncbi:peptidoglycan DD-metalloendopeptidase family protein [Candidatus Symbiobacter mobilis]|uniref:Lipoprotein NlpD n=1 Tax=Candidatus Symbiobacter mobilis CR TaxID=946483 RepID=U5N839_9BURK|nr:peptidoglycan DD-metalloendopeptidase family protein [Candidatus Symbiobacter mobilis]AGX87567.1 lipoprotein NlpD [Candidatus Symbiobacter mobilis CR]
MEIRERSVQAAVGVLAVLLLAGCGGTRLNHAPVEERATRAGNPGSVISLPNGYPAGVENAGKPGYYTVKPGDTLLRIALEHGQTVQDVSRWNQLQNPNRIEVGQVLRIAPPVGAPPQVRPVLPSAAGVAASQPLPPVRPVSGAVASASSPAAPVAPTSASAAPAQAPITWAWPATGSVLAAFDDVRNKGIDIEGATGAPVLAAADGRVVYVGSGLRGYGNLIILKHDNVFLTAYAHNKTLLVKEDQVVRKGEKIAEMGDSDADRVKLHFELRRNGKPVDPLKFLPARH